MGQRRVQGSRQARQGARRRHQRGLAATPKCPPRPNSISTRHAAYLHFTTNETIHGVEWPAEPAPPAGVPLVADMSSDFVSRPVDITKYGLIYAGAQKNLGPAGVTVVIIRRRLLERVPAGLPLMLDYRVMADNKSLYNTPPCFTIYVVRAGAASRLRDLGGLAGRRRPQRRQRRRWSTAPSMTAAASMPATPSPPAAPR